MSRYHNTNLSLYIILIIIVLTISVYYQVKNHDIINMDDGIYYNSSTAREGITKDGIFWAFRLTNIEGTYWHPLTWLSFMLGFDLYGENPGMHHSMNLMIHIFNCILLFVLFKKLTKEVWRSAFVSALFALHPLNVESVAWLTQRPCLLSTSFFLITILLYKYYTENRNIYRYLLILISFIFGLMSKSAILTLPFVLILLDYWPLNRLRFPIEKSNIIPLIYEKIPLLILSAVSIYTTIISIGKLASTETIPFSSRLGNAAVGYVLYLFKMIWPYNLTVHYPRPDFVNMWMLILSIILLFGITVFVLKNTQEKKYLTVGWFWFIGTLVPLMGLIQKDYFPQIADRYAYISFIGIFIMLVWGLSDIYKKFKIDIIYIVIIALLFISNLIITSWIQTGKWKNSITLFEHAIKVTNNNALAHNNLGSALAKENEIDEAIYNFKKAIEIYPYFKKAVYNLGLALLSKGTYDESIKYFNQYKRIEPDDMRVYVYLGTAYTNIGEIEKAIKYYKKALEYDKANEGANFGIAKIYAFKGNFDQAIVNYNKVIKENHENIEAYINLGNIYYKQKKISEAIYNYNKAIILNPKHVQANLNLAGAFLLAGETKKALLLYKKVEKMNPENLNLRKQINHIYEKIERLNNNKKKIP